MDSCSNKPDNQTKGEVWLKVWVKPRCSVKKICPRPRKVFKGTQTFPRAVSGGSQGKPEANLRPLKIPL